MIYAGLGVAVLSLIVSMFTARYSYRNNFGWPPGIIVKAVGFWVYKDKPALKFEFEVWNRFKYGIALQSVAVQFHNLKIEQGRPPLTANKETDFAPGHTILFGPEERLEPHAKSMTKFDIICYPEKETAGRARCVIDAQFYNPRTNKVEHTELSFPLKGAALRAAKDACRVGAWALSWQKIQPRAATCAIGCPCGAHNGNVCAGNLGISKEDRTKLTTTAIPQDWPATFREQF